MAKETEVIEETIEKEVTIYKCDKCHGRNHEETQFKDDLNKVVFDAEVYGYGFMTLNHGHDINTGSTTSDPYVSGKYEYLLCDECMERAHDYLADFF